MLVGMFNAVKVESVPLKSNEFLVATRGHRGRSNKDVEETFDDTWLVDQVGH
jgi:hypothetical protein